MNILLATYSYFPYDFGGTEVYVAGLARYLKSLGHQVQIVAATSDRAFLEHPVFYSDEEIKAVRYDWEEIPVLGVILNHNMLEDSYGKFRENWVTSWRQVLNKLNVGNWDILHMNCNTAAVGLALLKAVRVHSITVHVFGTYHIPQACTKNTLLRAKSMIPCTYKASERNCLPCFISTKTILPLEASKLLSVFLPGFSQAGLPMLLRMKNLIGKLVENFNEFDAGINRWVCFSEDMNGHLLVNGIDQKKISVIRHGIDNQIFWHRGNEQRKPGRFMYVGRLTRYKGIFTLLAAWMKLDKKPDTELLIVGREHLEDPEVKAWRNKTVNRDDIKWLGEKSSAEVADLMRQSGCVIIPSEWIETGPLVFHEAIACGADVIASDIGGCKELSNVYPDKAQVFKVGNADHLANTIRNFRFSGTSARVETAAEHYAAVTDLFTMNSVK